jgi:hypothetical protein
MIPTFACAGSSATSARIISRARRANSNRPGQPLVEFEMMTWPEVKAAMAAGKTTALFYTGGTEQRGPQNVNGGHTLAWREPL